MVRTGDELRSECHSVTLSLFYCGTICLGEGENLYLKEYPVEIPFEKYRIVIRKEKWVSLETKRIYNKETKDSRVQRKVIGQVVPLFPGKMYPNENYFSLVPNDVPAEVRNAFLRRCERKRELAELKKDPERMMRHVDAGLRFLKEKGRAYKMEAERQKSGRERTAGDDSVGTEQLADGTGMDRVTEPVADGTVRGGDSDNGSRFWFITDAHELEYAMKVFGDLYNIMEVYTSRNPKDTVEATLAGMFNRILEELKLTMPEHRILQGLELIRGPEDGGMTYREALMLLTFYKNCLRS